MTIQIMLRLYLAYAVIAMGLITSAYAESTRTLPLDNIQLKRLTLKDATTLLSFNNREILSAKQLVDIADANIKMADHAPNPVLSVGMMNIDLNRGKANTNYAIQNNQNSLMNQTYDTYVMYAQLWERGDKRTLRKNVAESAFNASQLDLEDTFRQQYLTLKNAYYDLKLAQEVLQVQQENMALYQSILKATELRVKAGDASVSDLSRIEVDVMRNSNDLRLAEANIEKAQASLAYVIGRENESSAIFVTEMWPSYHEALQSNFDSAILQQRPDVLAADTRITQSTQSIKLAESLKVRDLNIMGRYDHFPGQQTGMFTNTIGAQVDIPLFTNYQYEGELARAEASYQNAITAKSQTMAMAMVELKQSRANLIAAADRSKRFDEDILKKAEKNAHYAELAYNHGASSVLDLLDARRVLRALQVEALTVKADYAKALSAWQAANFSMDMLNKQPNQ